MKKFTFIAMLLAVFAMTAKAELMDKYFFKVPTDKMDTCWVIQDAGNFASTPGREYLEVQNKKNGGRMLNYFCNEAAWNGVDPATLPNSTYKFTMDLNMSNMAARADMEFTLLPVGICTPTDNRVSTHNYHWYKVNDGDDYFFRWRVGEKPAAANGDFTIWINEEPTAKNDWTQTTEETLTISSQKTYKFAVEINVAEKTATYTIADEEGTVLKTGVHKYTCAEDRAGIFVFGMNGTSTHQLSNIGLCYAAEGPFATEPNGPALAKPTLSLRCSIEVEPNWLVTTSSAACSSTSMSSPISSSGSMLSFFSASLAICSMSSRYFGLRWVRTNSTALRISDSDTHEPCTRIGLAEPIGRNNASP